MRFIACFGTLRLAGSSIPEVGLIKLGLRCAGVSVDATLDQERPYRPRYLVGKGYGDELERLARH